MTNKEYREHEGVSRSELWTINKSPLHSKYEQEHPKEDTPSLLFGRALHKMMLEPDTFDQEFAVAPQVNLRTNVGKEEYNRFLLNNPGKEVIKQDDYYEILAMCDVAHQDEEVMRLLRGEHEQSFFWTDPDTGEKCKCRPDCVTEIDGQVYLIDYKTTDSCAGADFERSCRKYGYDFQAGMYTEGYMAATFQVAGFKFIAQEKKAPYAIRIYDCNPEYIQQGVDKFRELLGIYHECKATGNWYGYEGPHDVETVLYGE